MFKLLKRTSYLCGTNNITCLKRFQGCTIIKNNKPMHHCYVCRCILLYPYLSFIYYCGYYYHVSDNVFVTFRNILSYLLYNFNAERHSGEMARAFCELCRNTCSILQINFIIIRTLLYKLAYHNFRYTTNIKRLQETFSYLWFCIINKEM